MKSYIAVLFTLLLAFSGNAVAKEIKTVHSIVISKCDGNPYRSSQCEDTYMTVPSKTYVDTVIQTQHQVTTANLNAKFDGLAAEYKKSYAELLKSVNDSMAQSFRDAINDEYKARLKAELKEEIKAELLQELAK